jgi:hypothetical protein
MRQYISYSQTSRTFDSVRRELSYNILTEFEVPMELVGLIKMCLNATYSRVSVANNCLICFLLKIVYNKGMLHRQLSITS